MHIQDRYAQLHISICKMDIFSIILKYGCKCSKGWDGGLGDFFQQVNFQTPGQKICLHFIEKS